MALKSYIKVQTVKKFLQANISPDTEVDNHGRVSLSKMVNSSQICRSEQGNGWTKLHSRRIKVEGFQQAGKVATILKLFRNQTQGIKSIEL